MAGDNGAETTVEILSLDKAVEKVGTAYTEYKEKEAEVNSALDSLIKAIEDASSEDYLVWVIPDFWMMAPGSPKAYMDLTIWQYPGKEGVDHHVVIPCSKIVEVGRPDSINNKKPPQLFINFRMREKDRPGAPERVDSVRALVGPQQLRIYDAEQMRQHYTNF